jgi:histidinol-phosphate aminotransferase
VTTLGQVAAAEALRHPDRLAERVHENARGRAWLAVELAARNVEVAPSQTNFVMLLGDRDTEGVAKACLEKGVIIRTLGQSARISVGTPNENARFIEVWDEVASAHPAR